MSIEQIIRSWKADEQEQDQTVLENPVGEQLSEQELAEVVGGSECSGTQCPFTLTKCFPYTSDY